MAAAMGGEAHAQPTFHPVRENILPALQILIGAFAKMVNEVSTHLEHCERLLAGRAVLSQRQHWTAEAEWRSS